MTTATGKLPTRTKATFGLGSLAFGLKDQALGAFVLIYYNQVIGLPAAWVGLAMAIAMFANAVADPLIGQYSDHFKSRLGRRHPFMYASALPYALCFALLWSPPEGSHELQFAWLLGTLVLLWVATAAFEVPSTALMAEMTNDYEERTSLSLWRAIFLAIGLIGGGMVALKLFLVATPEQPVGQLNQAGYEQYGIVAAIVIFITSLIATRGTQDRIPLLAPPKPRARDENLLANLKLLFTDRPYMSLVACLFFFGVGGGVLGALGTYIQTYFWILTADHLATLAGVGGLGAILGLIMAGSLKKADKRSIAIGAYTLALIAACIPIALQLTGVINLTGDAAMTIVAVKSLVVTAAVATGMVLGGSMMADCADHMELKTGRRMEGLMFAAMIMVGKGVSGVGNLVSGLVLTWVAFPDKAVPGQVDAATIQQLGLVYVIGLGSFVALALAAVAYYPITRKTHEDTVAKLKAQREAIPAGAAF